MDKHGIDASIGLEFSLDLFERYKSTGTLQVQLRRFPSIHGPCIVYVYLVEGVVVSCYIADKKGQHSPVSTDVLIRFDNEKGPFEWGFHSSSVTPETSTPLPPASAVVSYAQNTEPLSFPIPHAVVSKLVSSLPSERLLAWTLQQRRVFLLVWHEIDGQKTVQDIKAALGLALSETAIEETLLTLLKLKLIVISA